MYDTTHPAHAKLGQIGREITTRVRPAAVVIFSAHWQSSSSSSSSSGHDNGDDDGDDDGNGDGDGRDTVEINVDEKAGLIYEYVNTLWSPSSFL